MIIVKKPKIRFKGFTETWEQRKLGSICKITMGQSPNGSTYSETPCDYILVQGNADLKDGWVVPRIWTSQITKTAKSGDLIMSVRAPAGAIGKTAYDVVIGRGVASINGNEFIYQTLKKYEIEGYWRKIATGSTFKSINSEDINDTILFVPIDDSEQKQIGSLFSKLDNLITLHQRQCENLKKLKKFMLQKLFPQNGENVPEIRFSNFTDTWEQRKLNEICNYHSSSLTAKDSCTDGEYDLFDVNSLIGKTSSSCIDENYITIIKDGAGVGRTRLLPKNTMFLGTMGALTPKGIDLNFLFQIVSKAELGRFCTGSTIPHIYFRDYGENLFFVPSNREQKPIGDYFSKLDNLITLHQSKCDKLIEVKKYMLQNMFI